MRTQERFYCGTQGKMVTLFDVRRLARYACHQTLDGHLFEYDQRRFWHTNLVEEEPEREPVEDELSVPLGPWYHHPLCDCEVCGPG